MGEQKNMLWRSELGDEKISTLGRLEDQINNQHLHLIEQMFKEADTSGSGGLDMYDFRDAMKRILGDLDDEDIDTIFMKVDSNCDGSLEWEDYMNYMLLEYREKDTLQQKDRPLYFPKPLKMIPSDRHDMIVRIQFSSFQPPAGKKDPVEQKSAADWVKTRAHGRYLSICRNGTLNFWSERFKLQRTVNISEKAHTVDQPIRVTDMVCLNNINQLCIACTARDIEFYDISASKCDVIYSLAGLEANVMVMDYWTDGQRGIYSIGDTSGTVFIFTSVDVVQNGLFNSVVFKTVGNIPRIAVSSLFKNSSLQFLCFKITLHSDWIRQIRYIPELNAVASCCTADRTSMVLTSVPHSDKYKIHTTRFHLQKGIRCFDYSPEFNILVTGGFDRIIRVWNPYVTNRATSQMKGCSAAITHLMVIGRLNKVVSISKDKNVCVWDLHDCVCVQNIHPMNISMGRFPISSTCYNYKTNTVVLATYRIGVLQGLTENVESAMVEAVTSHEQPLCTALYNANFRQVVSGCHAGEVKVWDILSGEKIMQFQTNPEYPVEVTAMAFDGPKRRLITGSKNGVLRLWNFNNGALLRQLPLVDKSEITGILYINERIYVSGWSKQVVSYVDCKDDKMLMDYRVWNQYHTEDIYSMHFHGNKLLVTASYNGDIIIWNLDSGQAFCSFNASKSPCALVPVRTRQRSFQTSSVNGSALDGVKESSRKSKVGNVDRTANLDTPRMAVEKVLFLKTRERSPDTAILLSSAADGCVYAWSIGHSGGLLGKFRPAQRDGSVICSMSTDSCDQLLLTGDNHGYIMLWDIEKYCNGTHGQTKSGDQNQSEEKLRLWELIPHYCRVQGPRRLKTQQEKEVRINGWSVSLTPPKLLSSWRCHVEGIVHLEFVERYHLIVTASLDCNVRLWNITGRYIGTFGESLWRVDSLDEVASELPLDLRRVGSYQTLKVLNKGRHPHWSAKQILAKLASQRQLGSMTAIREPKGQQGELVAVDPNITTYSCDQVQHTSAQEQEKDRKASSILGQAYQQKVRHRLPSCAPVLYNSLGSRQQLRVYNAMHCTDLLPTAHFPVPDLHKDHHKRMQEIPEQRKFSRRISRNKARLGF